MLIFPNKLLFLFLFSWSQVYIIYNCQQMHASRLFNPQQEQIGKRASQKTSKSKINSKSNVSDRQKSQVSCQLPGTQSRLFYQYKSGKPQSLTDLKKIFMRRNYKRRQNAQAKNAVRANISLLPTFRLKSQSHFKHRQSYDRLSSSPKSRIKSFQGQLIKNKRYQNQAQQNVHLQLQLIQKVRNFLNRANNCLKKDKAQFFTLKKCNDIVMKKQNNVERILNNNFNLLKKSRSAKQNANGAPQKIDTQEQLNQKIQFTNFIKEFKDKNQLSLAQQNLYFGKLFKKRALNIVERCKIKNMQQMK